MAAPATGMRFGPYELMTPVGAGGMGEVWKARDTRLNRTVAIKFAQAHLSDRFEREARAIAALNHPNVCQIHDVGDSYIVMEFVEGEPLRPPDSTRKLLDLAVQIADGLAAAHASGFIHRDLKPDNILVTRDGRVKILDFGLARQAAAETVEATRTIAITNPGTVVGTALYMSPEQARGQELDPRSDQFSFGLILYELATGKRAFARDSAAETMAAIIREEQESLPPTVPPPLRWMIERCLSKDPSARYESTRDLYLELSTLRQRLSEISATAPEPAAKPRRKPRWWLAGAIAATIVGAAATALWIKPRPSSVPTWNYTPFATTSSAERSPAWSPDGKTIAYLGRVDGVWQVFTRRVDGLLPVQITTGDQNAGAPAWSADGSRIYFALSGDTYYAGAAGGAPQLFLKDAHNVVFSRDGKRLAFVRTSDRTLWFAKADATNAAKFSRGNFPKTPRGMTLAWAPQGDKVAVGVTVFSDRETLRRELWVVRNESNATKVPVEDEPGFVNARGASWADNRHLIITATTGGEMQAYRIDTETGSHQRRTSGILSHVDASVSPDGTQVACTVEHHGADVLEIDAETGRARVAVGSSLLDVSPAWSPSGRGFAYVSGAVGRFSVWIQPDSGPAHPVPLGEGYGTVHKLAFSPDGQRLVLDQFSPSLHRVLVAPVVGGTPVVIDQGATDAHSGSISPDGRWIAYRRTVAAGTFLTKIPIGGGQPADLISLGRGAPDAPLQWSPAGDWIAYSASDPGEVRMTSPDGKHTRVLLPGSVSGWTISADGARAFAIRRGEGRKAELHVTDVKTGVERKLSTVDISPDLTFRGLSVHGDGRRLLTTVTDEKSDIWILSEH